MLSKTIITTATCFIMSHALAADKVPLPSATTQVSPIAGAAVGKVTYVSINTLPAGMKERTERDAANIAKGYEVVGNEVFLRRDNYHDRLRQESDVRDNMRVKLSNTETTSLSKYEYEGIMPDGPSREGPWTSIIRVFKRPDGIPIFVSEWDFVADGGSVVIVKELMNTKVDKTPARLIVKKSQDGKNLSELSWASSKKYYTISVWDDVTEADSGGTYDKKWLLQIAEGLNNR
jgi:hypothetical protein